MNPVPHPLPILYSFRRCPYAMRARMALHSAEIELEHREIVFRNKPPAMLAVSAKGTVPVLVLTDGKVIDESWDVVQWALHQNDPENWLGQSDIFLTAALPLVAECDSSFKRALDQYKYADRHPLPAETYRDQGLPFLHKLESMLANQRFLLAEQCSIADIAVMPFVRQFAHVDKPWFAESGLKQLQHWLDHLIGSPIFTGIMEKHPLWQSDLEKEYE